MSVLRFLDLMPFELATVFYMLINSLHINNLAKNRLTQGINW